MKILASLVGLALLSAAPAAATLVVFEDGRILHVENYEVVPDEPGAPEDVRDDRYRVVGHLPRGGELVTDIDDHADRASVPVERDSKGVDREGTEALDLSKTHLELGVRQEQVDQRSPRYRQLAGVEADEMVAGEPARSANHLVSYGGPCE